MSDTAETTDSTDVRVLLVDDDPLVRAGLRAMLDGLPLPDRAVTSSTPDARTLRIVGEAGDGDEVPDAVAQTRPDVVLMDLRMPRRDGVTATAHLRRQPEPPAVVALTTFDADEYVLDALRAGATGFLLKDTPPESLVAAVRAAADGEPVLSPRITDRLIDMVVSGGAGDHDGHAAARAQLEGLTRREHEVARAVGRGCSNAQIAAELYMGVDTVKAHVSHILSVLDLDNRVQIALLIRDAET